MHPPGREISSECRKSSSKSQNFLPLAGIFLVRDASALTKGWQFFEALFGVLPATELHGATFDTYRDSLGHFLQKVFDHPFYWFLSLPSGRIEPLIKVPFAIDNRSVLVEFNTPKHMPRMTKNEVSPRINER